MARSSGFLKSLLPAVLLLAVGVVVFIYLIATPRQPIPDEAKTVARRVRVFPAEKVTTRLTTTAYGTSRASEDWITIAEVSGRAEQVSDRFEVGEILPAGSVLVEIDKTDYRLAESRLQAEIDAQQAQLVELGQKESNLRKIIALQQEQLALAEEEYRRLRSLWESKAASDSAMDAAQNSFLGYQTTRQETQNQLDLIPVQRKLVDASLEALKVQLEQARRNLEKCTIKLPFAARCASKSVEVDQFVTAGERLGRFLAMDKAEVVAMVEPRKMRALFPHGIEALGTLDLTNVDQEQSLFKQVDVPADVRWGPGREKRVWHGHVARLGSGLDLATQSLPVIVEVPDPYKDVVPGVRPPLVPDLFCEVTFYGATVNDVVVVPRDCLHELPQEVRGDTDSESWPEEADYSVYLYRDGRLHIAPVDILILDRDHAVIERGIDQGDMVILTDLFPASEGMLLEAEVDETGKALPPEKSAEGGP